MNTLVLTLPLCHACSRFPLYAGEVAYTSTAEWGVCAVCREHFYWHGPTAHVTVRARLIEEEPCDCGDTIRHNTGGNYHTATWQVVEIVEVVKEEEEEMTNRCSQCDAPVHPDRAARLPGDRPVCPDCARRAKRTGEWELWAERARRLDRAIAWAEYVEDSERE